MICQTCGLSDCNEDPSGKCYLCRQWHHVGRVEVTMAEPVPSKLTREELAARFMAALLISDAQGLWEDFAEDAFACADAFIKARDEVAR